MTKADLRARTKQVLGGRTGGNLTDAWYDERVLNGYKRLITYQGPVQVSDSAGPRYRALRFPEHEDRKSRTLSYATLASNFVANQTGVLQVMDIFDRTNDVALTNDGERAILSRDPDETGTPRLWCPAGRGGVVGYLVWPFPGSSDDDIDVYEYVITTPALAADSTSPLIDSAWHMAIVYAAAAEGAALLDWPEKSAELNDRFMRVIAENVTLFERATLGSHASRRRNLAIMDL